MKPDESDERRAAALEKLTRVLSTVGFPHSTALIYAALTLAPGEGLSTTELVESLHVSRASVSNATQFLVGTELVQRYRVAGSRETHYRILKGAWGPILGKKFAGAFAVRKTVEEAMSYTESELALERLEEMKDVYGFFEQEFVEIMKRWDEREKS